MQQLSWFVDILAFGKLFLDDLIILNKSEYLRTDLVSSFVYIWIFQRQFVLGFNPNIILKTFIFMKISVSYQTSFSNMSRDFATMYIKNKELLLTSAVLDFFSNSLVICKWPSHDGRWYLCGRDAKVINNIQKMWKQNWADVFWRLPHFTTWDGQH